MNEIQIPQADQKGLPIYAVLSRNEDGKYLTASGNLETYNLLHWGTYIIPLLPSGDGTILQASIPATAPAGTYSVTLREYSGDAPAIGDGFVSADDLSWFPVSAVTGDGYDLVAQRSAILACTGLGSELVTYTQDGVPKSLRVQVQREAPINGLQFEAHSLSIQVCNHPVLGVSAVNKNRDAVTIPYRLGLIAKSLVVVDVLPDTDPYTWSLLLNMKG